MAMRLSNGTGGGNWTNVASWAVAVPGLGDTAQIVAGDTITIDATFQVGDDTATPALDILNGGEVDWDNGGNDTIDLQGDFYVRNGGTLILDGTANGANTLTINLNRSATLLAGEFGLIIEDGAIVNCDGFNKTRSWDTLSADAAAGQLNVVTTNDNSAVWNAGDEFVVGSMSTQFKAGAETDTIGVFAGGNVITKAGANYASIHEEDVAFINLTRNVVFTSFNTAFEGYIYITNNTPGNVVFDWCEFSYLGTNAATKYGVSVITLDYAIFNYCAFHHCYRGLTCVTTGRSHLTVSQCVFGRNISIDINRVSSTGSVSSIACLGSDDIAGYVLECDITGSHFGNADDYSFIQGAGAPTIQSCYFYSCARGVRPTTLAVATFDSCFFDNNSITALRAEVAITRLVDCSFGVTTANTVDIYSGTIVIGTGINTIVLTVTVTGSADNRVSIEDTGNDHKTWKATGDYEKQAGVVRTGAFAMLMSPTSATDPLIAESTVPASNGVQIVVSCYMRKNPAYGGANLPFLRLSGKGVTTDTDAMTNVDNVWQLLVVSGTPTSDGFCKVEFVGQSAGGGAACYVDDVKMVYVAIDTGSMDFWFEGDTPTVLMATGLGAVDVWDVLESQIDTAAVSMGRLVLKGMRAIRRML